MERNLQSRHQFLVILPDYGALDHLFETRLEVEKGILLRTSGMIIAEVFKIGLTVLLVDPVDLITFQNPIRLCR